MKNTGIPPEECPTPAYHETHRYCPSCDWDETMDVTAAVVDDDPLPRQPHYERAGHIVVDAPNVPSTTVFVCSWCYALVAAENKHKHTAWHTGAVPSGETQGES